MKKHIWKYLQYSLLGLVFFFFSQKSTMGQETPNDINFSSRNNNYERIEVRRVIKADEIELENGEKIKLIGLKAPAAPKPEKKEFDEYGFEIKNDSPLTPLEEEAFIFTKKLLENKMVRLEFDKQKRNEELKTLAYVFLIDDNIFVNKEILRQGFANLTIRPPNIKYADTLRQAYQEARQEKRGLQGE